MLASCLSVWTVPRKLRMRVPTGLVQVRLDGQTRRVYVRVDCCLPLRLNAMPVNSLGFLIPFLSKSVKGYRSARCLFQGRCRTSSIFFYLTGTSLSIKIKFRLRLFSVSKKGLFVLP